MRCPPLEKLFNAGATLRLGAVAVDAGRAMAGAGQALGYAFGAVLGADENQEAAFFGLQQMLKELLLLVGGHFEGLQANVLGRLEDRTNFDADGVSSGSRERLP